jgi:hypothetical protein
MGYGGVGNLKVGGDQVDITYERMVGLLIGFIVFYPIFILLWLKVYDR